MPSHTHALESLPKLRSQIANSKKLCTTSRPASAPSLGSRSSRARAMNPARSRESCPPSASRWPLKLHFMRRVYQRTPIEPCSLHGTTTSVCEPSSTSTRDGTGLLSALSPALRSSLRRTLSGRRTSSSTLPQTQAATTYRLARKHKHTPATYHADVRVQSPSPSGEYFCTRSPR